MDVVDPVLNLCLNISQMIDNVKANKERCQQITKRIKALEELVIPIKQRGSGQISAAVENALKELFITMNYIKGQIMKYSKANNIKSFVKSLAYEGMFAEMNEKLSYNYQILSAALQVEHRNVLEKVYEIVSGRPVDEGVCSGLPHTSSTASVPSPMPLSSPIGTMPSPTLVWRPTTPMPSPMPLSSPTTSMPSPMPMSSPTAPPMPYPMPMSGPTAPPMPYPVPMSSAHPPSMPSPMPMSSAHPPSMPSPMPVSSPTSPVPVNGMMSPTVMYRPNSTTYVSQPLFASAVSHVVISSATPNRPIIRAVQVPGTVTTTPLIRAFTPATFAVPNRPAVTRYIVNNYVYQ